MAQRLNSKLPEFLWQEAARPWIWGEHDCGLWLADWLSFATGAPDPAAHLRGKYVSAATCEALYGSAAVLRMTRVITRLAGLRRTADPMLGDIAVLAVRTGEGAKDRAAVGAIRGGNGWVIPAETKFRIGLTRLPDNGVRVIAAWRIEESDAAGYSVFDRSGDGRVARGSGVCGVHLRGHSGRPDRH